MAVDPRICGAHVLWNPIQRYLCLLRHPCKQVLSWDPEDVHKRDRDCDEQQWFFDMLGLRGERWTVQLHNNCAHYTPGLMRHGNLVGCSAEGGEHCHKEDKKAVGAQPSLPRGKCPKGLLACTEH